VSGQDAAILIIALFVWLVAMILVIIHKHLANSRLRRRLAEEKRYNAAQGAVRGEGNMGTITINGKTYSGNSIQVSGNAVYIDGKLADEEGDSTTRIVKIIVEGDLVSVNAERGSVEVRGDVGTFVKAGGSVACKNVGGDADAGGSINCGNVSGDVDAGGSVNCGSVGGDIDAGGSVRHR